MRFHFFRAVLDLQWNWETDTEISCVAPLLTRYEHHWLEWHICLPRMEPTLTQNWLWHVICLRAQSWWCTFSGSGQMCKDTDSPSRHHTVFPLPWKSSVLCLLIFPSRAPPLATTNLFIVSLVSCLFQNLHSFQIKSIESRKLKEG